MNDEYDWGYDWEMNWNNKLKPIAEMPIAGITVDVPDWANMDKDYHPVDAERFGNDGCYPMVVTYAPNSTLGIGFKRVFIVEKSTQKPFHRMKDMWNELKMSIQKMGSGNDRISSPHLDPMFLSALYRIHDNIKVSDNGELRSAFGVPSTNELYGIVSELSSMYNIWRKFPNEPDWKSVEKLMKAMDKISQMQMHSGDLEGEIDESRRMIKEQQDRIAELENRLNKIYEDGADAMNLLEEHGVKVDMDGNIQFDSDSEDIDIPALNQVINYYGDQYITISPNDESRLITTSNNSLDSYTVASYN